MKVVVVGAGSIGGLLGAKLSLVEGCEVTLVARGDHLKTMLAQGGIRIKDARTGKTTMYDKVHLTGELSGKFDVVVLAVKAHQIARIADKIEGLCASEESIIVPLQNGLPWWYFYKEGGKFDGAQLKSMDPTADLAKFIRLERIIGCIAYPAASILEPGLIEHVEGRAFPLGEPDRSKSPRAIKLSRLFEAAEFRAPVQNDFRDEIWLKLMGNVCFNPISALTRADLRTIVEFEASRKLCLQCMRETEHVANKLGCKMRVTVEKRMEKAREKFGSHKTSMLQDLENRKPVEVDILNGICEVADMLEIEIPHIHTLRASTLLLNEVISKL